MLPPHIEAELINEAECCWQNWKWLLTQQAHNNHSKLLNNLSNVSSIALKLATHTADLLVNVSVMSSVSSPSAFLRRQSLITWSCRSCWMTSGWVLSTKYLKGKNKEKHLDELINRFIHRKRGTDAQIYSSPRCILKYPMLGEVIKKKKEIMTIWSFRRRLTPKASRTVTLSTLVRWSLSIMAQLGKNKELPRGISHFSLTWDMQRGSSCFWDWIEMNL